jgi:uncharacterized phage protein (TIGR01671 family)
MREIKFRAWDKVAKKFLFPWPEGFYILGETTCFDLIGHQLKERSPEKSTLEMLNDVEIMQYTGLKDRNGKEIYEGDVCKDICINGNEYAPLFVIFDEGAFSLKYSESYIPCLCDIDLDHIEIVGNIYENPELMEVA